MIPDFQTLMLPFLKAIADEREYAKKEIVDILAQVMNLTEEEKVQTLPSRNQPVFYNRVSWVVAHFKAARVIENTRRGYIKITE
jgi:restriction system protein